MRLVLALVATATVACAADDAEPVRLAVTGPADAELGAASVLAVTIYGYDPLLADVEASVIDTAELPLTALPATLEIVLPADAHTRIRVGDLPPEVAAADARYYLAVYGDLDGDGEICPGELAKQWDQRAGFGPDAPAAAMPITLIPYAADLPCRPALPE